MSDDDPWLPVPVIECLATVLTHFSKKQNIHRVPVITYGEIRNEEIKGLLTQSRVVQYLTEHYKDLPFTTRKKTVNEWHQGQNTNYRKAVETVLYTDGTFLAYRILTTKAISGVGIINDSGRLVGSLSGTDFRRRIYPNDFDRTVTELYKPVGMYMNCDLALENFTCRLTDTVDELLKKFTDYKLHRLYIVDKEGKPLSVISLCDILTLFQVD